ncbi:MAG: ABC transporter permease subunit [Planctomycetia bacterium]|nr:ABC transporter permease subunit [Planctomycetia bacterium]
MSEGRAPGISRGSILGRLLSGGLTTFAFKRLLISIPLVFVMTFVMFVTVNTQGSSRFDTFENDPAADPQIVEMEKRRMHIYDPIHVRYFYWLRGVMFDVRFTADRRYVATFEDNDPSRGDDKYKFGGSEVRLAAEGVGGDYEVPGPAGVPLGALGQPATLVKLLEPKDFETLLLSTADASVPEGLALSVVAGSGSVPLPFQATAGKPATLAVDLDELNRQSSIDQIREIRLVAAKPGKASIRAELVKRRVWQETYPGRAKKRTIQLVFRGTPGEAAELGALKSPYAMKLVEGSDWKADWASVQEKVDEGAEAAHREWKAGGMKSPEPEAVTVDRVDFDALEFEAHALQGADLPVSVWILHGDREKPQAAKIADLKLGSEEKTWELPLAGFPAGVDLRQVRGLRFTSDAPGRAEFDDFRLRVAGNPFRIGAPNFGTSWDKKKGVLDLIGEKVKNTISLNIFSLVFVWLFALPIGIYGAVRQHSNAERTLSFLTFVGMSLPSFFLAILLVFLVSLTYDIAPDSPFRWMREILPIAGRTSQDHSAMGTLGQMWDIAKHTFLPVTVGVLGGVGGLQRVLRGTMLEERRKLYLTTAMAKGLPPVKVLYKHALRNAIIPFVASSGSLLSGMMAGSAFTEIVFDYPGIGRQMLESVLSYDMPVVMANLLISGLLLVVGNLLADIGLGLVDPRVSVEG